MSVAQAASTPTPALGWLDLKQREELNKLITIECKRIELSGLMKEIEQQTGIQLSLSSELSLAKKLITARIDRMRLYDFMTAVARTYTAKWTYTSNNHYELGLQNSDESTLMLSRIGTPLFYRYRESGKTGLLEKEQRRRAIYNQIVGEVGKESLNQRQGIMVDMLSEETQSLLRAEYEQMFALHLLQLAQRYVPALSSNLILRVSASQKEVHSRWQEEKMPEGFIPPELPEQIYFTLEFLDEEKNSLSIPEPLKWTFSQKLLEADPK